MQPFNASQDEVQPRPLVVGWHLTSDESCGCGRTATALVEDSGSGYYYSCCGACVPRDARDVIAEAFNRALGQA